ncbi:hypothetical protein DI270_005745 [Microbispora triticiradicis]|uniref:SnoaL-like domain-containing protein n=1 Tax=Microbispora triticiradicis TaxID=2200763 RepID=A0ABX9LPT6_9ACTN|nr:hypothetical protein [Microbispora triticiradicis]RGA05897.1 hypothetical protein DI270_005745 [Microbispora triticiradicis]
MTRPGLATAAATLLVSACALLTSACAAPDADHGFTPGGGAAAPAAAGAATGVTGDETGDGTGDNVITAAPGLRIEIDWPQGLDPVRSAVVKAFADDFTAQWRAVGTLGEDRSYTKGIDPGSSAFRDADKWVHGFLKDRQSARGVAKVYSLTVPAIMGRGAEADACVDLTGVRLTDHEGTPLAGQPAWLKRPRAVFLQTAGLRRGDDGAWRIAMYHHADYPDERAKECLR